MSSSIRELSFKLIERYFEDNPNYLVSHHLESFNEFFGKRIFDIFRQNNPVKFLERVDNPDGLRNEARLYLGGKVGNRLYYGSPIIYDEKKTHLMYPNDARLRSMTYGMSIHFDVDVEMTYYVGTDKKEHTFIIEKVFLGMFPVMVGSKYCILSGLSPEIKYNIGECKHDYGGYFIIDGKEKSVLPQETFADNMLYVRANAKDNDYSHSAEIRSVSEDTSKHTRTTSVKRVAPSASFANEQIVVDVPNVKKPVPLFILMRALGVVTDKAIVEACLLDTEKYASYIDMLVPSVHDASMVFTQETALRYIATFTKRETLDGVLDILANYFLPHVGDMNFRDKALFVGHMVLNLLKVVAGDERPTDRDSFKLKRVELTGVLLYDLFREYYQIYKATVGQTIDKEFYYHAASYEGEQFVNLIEANATKLFAERAVELGVKRAFKGKWGATPHTSRIGVVQDLNRLSWFTFISQLRKIILPLDASAKVVGPRHLNSSQWGLVDPVDTPDGGHIGLHKHLSICTVVTSGESAAPLIAWMREHLALMLLQECTTRVLATHTKVFVNGNWIGVVAEPLEIREQMVHLRRRGDPILSVFTSIRFDSQRNELLIYTDSGRLMRPIYPVESVPSLVKASEAHTQGFVVKKTWAQLLGQKNTDSPLLKSPLTKGGSNNAALIEYLDTSESESALIAMTLADVGARTTHLEIDPSLLFGVMGNSIIFPEFNQFPRDVFSCGQSRQACSMYHTNYQMRMDKMGVVLNYGQTPLVKSRYLKHINNEDMPYGVNTVVAIMSYTGYNVEDAILINRGSLDRGLFSTTYYTTVEAREETAKISKVDVNTVFTDVMSSTRTITGLKPGYDYSALDASGLCREGTLVHDKMMVIGALTTSSANPLVAADASTGTKKGQMGVVDMSFMTDNEEGTRLAKVRIREIRVPNLGDKMASRAGQKGTIGLVIPEEDMPFTADGVRPDLIINPHALPSRMTIGQLVESVLGLIGAHYGGFGDCTAFSNKGSNAATYGRALVNAGFHSSGCHVMYNGMTGVPVESDIYMGPTYYMRLKHMVKDKLNYRGKGPNQALTRQPVQGRANDGGLRIGEMEKDSIVSHGMTAFMTNTFMQRSDAYKIAICNQTGFVAAYNPERGLFLSPAADGVKFVTTANGEMNVEQISKFGRSFSILDVPYSFKLLMQELQAMGVHMRIITDSNINQLENLATATDVKIHLGSDVTDTSVKSYTAKIRSKLASSTKRPAPIIHRPAAPQPKPMPKYEIHSPVGPPPQTPQFIPQTPDTPEFQANTPPMSPQHHTPSWSPPNNNPVIVMTNPGTPVTVMSQQPSPEFAPYSPYVPKSPEPEPYWATKNLANLPEPDSNSPIYNPTEDLFKVDNTDESEKATETTKKINININPE